MAHFIQPGNQIHGASLGIGTQLLGNNVSAQRDNIFNFHAQPASEEVERRKCLRALFSTDPVDDRAKYISFKGEVISESFIWITKTPEYQRWLNQSTGSHLIWMSGSPGTGKTMMSIFLTEELEKIRRQNDRFLVLYYFCEGRDPKRNSPVGLLRGLIYTLIRQRPALMKHLLTEYESQEDGLFGQDAIEPLWRILTMMINDPDSGSVYCIIDGLDECHESSVERLEHLLKKIHHHFGGQRSRNGVYTNSSPGMTRSDVNGSVFKLAIVSRESPECLTRELSSFQRIRLGKQHHSEAESPQGYVPSTSHPTVYELEASTRIPKPSKPPTPPRLPSITPFPSTVNIDSEEKFSTPIEQISGYTQSLDIYISAKVADLAKTKRYNEKLQSDLRKSLHMNGDGTFLWVDMAIQQISQSMGTESESLLQGLPRGADGMYFLILLQLPQELVRTVSFILRWVAMSFRSLTLAELSAIYAFSRKAEEENDQATERFERAIVSCTNFLDINTENEVKLKHQTAHDFLTEPNSPLKNDPRLQNFWVNEADAHGEISQTCITYLEQSSFDKAWWHVLSAGKDPVTQEEIEPDQGFLKISPFILYAAIFWTEHFNKATPGTIDLSSPFFRPGNQVRKNWFRSAWEYATRQDGQLAPSNQSRLHIAAFFNLKALAELLCKSSDFVERVKKRNSEFQTPIFVAAFRGSVEVCDLLLRYDLNPILFGGTPLMYASGRGHLGVVQLLLDRGADANASVEEGMMLKSARTAFRLGPKRFRKYMTKYAESEEADKYQMYDLDYGGNTSALHDAAISGFVEVAELLIQRGANIHFATRRGWTALHFAAYSGNASLIELLMNYGGKKWVETEDGWTLLHCAAWRGKASATEFLINQNLALDNQTKEKYTALHFAAKEGFEDVARKLLQRGASTEYRTQKGSTPLHLAAAGGHEGMVRLLLEHGAFREAKSNAGDTAESLARKGRHTSIVQVVNLWRPNSSPNPNPRPSPNPRPNPRVGSGSSGSVPSITLNQTQQNVTLPIRNNNVPPPPPPRQSPPSIPLPPPARPSPPPRSSQPAQSPPLPIRPGQSSPGFKNHLGGTETNLSSYAIEHQRHRSHSNPFPAQQTPMGNSVAHSHSRQNSTGLVQHPANPQTTYGAPLGMPHGTHHRTSSATQLGYQPPSLPPRPQEPSHYQNFQSQQPSQPQFPQFPQQPSYAPSSVNSTNVQPPAFQGYASQAGQPYWAPPPAPEYQPPPPNLRQKKSFMKGLWS